MIPPSPDHVGNKIGGSRCLSSVYTKPGGVGQTSEGIMDWKARRAAGL